MHKPWRGPYDVDTTFHEPFVLFGYLASLTKRIELVTGVIILPQRQTVLRGSTLGQLKSESIAAEVAKVIGVFIVPSGSDPTLDCETIRTSSLLLAVL